MDEGIGTSWDEIQACWFLEVSSHNFFGFNSIKKSENRLLFFQDEVFSIVFSVYWTLDYFSQIQKFAEKLKNKLLENIYHKYFKKWQF